MSVPQSPQSYCQQRLSEPPPSAQNSARPARLTAHTAHTHAPGAVPPLSETRRLSPEALDALASAPPEARAWALREFAGMPPAPRSDPSRTLLGMLKTANGIFLSCRWSGGGGAAGLSSVDAGAAPPGGGGGGPK